MVQQPPSGPQRPHYRSFTIKLTQTHAHSVGLLWTNDQPQAETSTEQHTTLATERHPANGGIRTHNPWKREAADYTLEREVTGIGPKRM